MGPRVGRLPAGELALSGTRYVERPGTDGPLVDYWVYENLRAIDGVQQAHVTNVVDDHGGDAVGALVVSAAPLDEVATNARARLSAFKVPTCWVVTESADAVPMTRTAKIDKAALQTLLAREGTRR